MWGVEGAEAVRRRALRPVDRVDERRDQLAESALVTLGSVGYAKASLREIASNSPFTHGLVHYYFQDKIELVVYSVQSSTAGELVARFGDKLAQTLRDEAPMHRLWYDLRTQSMFEPQLHEAITLIDRTLLEMIWRVVSRYAELAGREPSVTPAVAYGMLDGLFQQALLAYGDGGEPVLTALVEQVGHVMPLLLAPAGSTPTP
jgi:AcrR family transcriptional regulator